MNTKPAATMDVNAFSRECRARLANAGALLHSIARAGGVARLEEVSAMVTVLLELAAMMGSARHMHRKLFLDIAGDIFDGAEGKLWSPEKLIDFFAGQSEEPRPPLTPLDLDQIWPKPARHQQTGAGA